MIKFLKEYKKLLVIFVALICVFLMVACAPKPTKLDTPTNLKISSGETLTWNAVAGADGYFIDINGEEFVAQTNSLDLFEIFTSPRMYNIKISAYSDAEDKVLSDWSQVLDYEVTFTPANFTLVEKQLKDGSKYFEISASQSANFGGKLVIPSSFSGIDILSIGSFANCQDITELFIPDTIQSVSMNAFAGCTNLKRVRWSPKTPIVDISVFEGCTSLTEMTFPEGVARVATSVFRGCSALKSVYLPASVDRITNLETFVGCDNLESLVVSQDNLVYKSDSNCIIEKSSNKLIAGCKTSVIPNYVTTIYNAAFLNIPINNITIPDSVAKIDDLAFCDTDLTEVFIPKSVTDIGLGAFANCSKLTKISVDPQNEVYKSDGNCIIEKSTNALIMACQSSVIPDYVTTIKASSFQGIAKDSIVISASVTKIEKSAFHYCGRLDIFYLGSKDNITIEKSEGCSYTLYSYSETEPEINKSGTAYLGNYWRYVDGVITVWVKEN